MANASSPSRLVRGWHRPHPDGGYRGKERLWKVSIDGGEPVQLTDKPATRDFFSPDGKQLACGCFVEGAKPPWKVALIPYAGGQPIKLLDLPPDVLHYSQSILYSMIYEMTLVFRI